MLNEDQNFLLMIQYIFDSFRQQTSVETAVLWDETEVYVSQRMFLFLRLQVEENWHLNQTRLT